MSESELQSIIHAPAPYLVTGVCDEGIVRVSHRVCDQSIREYDRVIGRVTVHQSRTYTI